MNHCCGLLLLVVTRGAADRGGDCRFACWRLLSLAMERVVHGNDAFDPRY